MRVILYHQPLDPSHGRIAEALRHSLVRDGRTCTELPIQNFDETQLDDADMVFTYHITFSQPIMDACFRKNIPVVYYDKGYTNRAWRGARADAYYRFSVNAFHPLHYFQSAPRPADRWEKLGLRLAPRQKNGRHVVFAGCSQKFADWHGFDVADYAARIIERIRHLSPRPIIYRPKKSAQPPPPLSGTAYSHRTKKIEEDLRDAFALVTFSSNTAVDAILAGVPAFVLGPGIARPVANTNLAKLEDPYFPSDEERLQWCHDLAYCQWRVDEIENGDVWRDLKTILERPESKPPKQTVKEDVFLTCE